MSEFGDNIVTTIDFSAPSPIVFCKEPYWYGCFRIDNKSPVELPNFTSTTIYCLSLPAGATIDAAGTTYTLNTGDAVQLEQTPGTLSVSTTDNALFLVSGVTTTNEARSVTVKRHPDIKRVEKPWGHELWINGQHPGYALKQIFVKKGTKTSLQYHNFKRETNLLLQGTARLHFKQSKTVTNDDVTPDDIGTTDLEPVSAVDVFPPTLHRLEAMTDILLYETSTPHLDDVIRVSDDSKRPDGRIDSEHSRGVNR